MIFDLKTLMSDKQAITGTAVSTNVLDLGATEAPVNRAATTNPVLTKDLGQGEAVPICVMVNEAFTLLTSLNFALYKDTVEGFGSAELVIDWDVVIADLVVGYLSPIIWVPRSLDQQYARFTYTVTGTNPDAGTITAGICMGNQTNIGG